MLELLLIVLLLVALDVAAIRWGSDSRGLDPNARGGRALGASHRLLHR